MFKFASPIFLILLGLVPLYLFWYFRRTKGRGASIRYSDLNLVRKARPSATLKMRHGLAILRAVGLSLLIVGLARPQSGRKSIDVETEGVDIMLVLDISGSMRAEDFKPQNRLHAAKEVIRDFIADRTSDRIGLVVFSRQSFTQCPLTLDYGVLLSFLEQVDFGMIEDGTAIGLSIANAVDRLKDSKAKSKVAILLTDGVNNAGEIDPLTAAELAKTFGVKIYTIGAGKPGVALYPVDDPLFGRRYVPLQVQLDEETLKEIAARTGGRYFRAKDTEGLKRIYEEISALEKTEIKVKEYMQYSELFGYFAIYGFVFLAIELILANTKFRRIP
jgi:Ca-activated chloride channel family protein